MTIPATHTPSTAAARLGVSDSPEFVAKVSARRAARMALVDNLPEDIRSLVHDYGLNVVKAIMDIGVKEPRHIRHIVETVLNEFSPTRGNFSSQGHRAPGNTP